MAFAVIPIQTPCLKDVKEDIPLLVDYFIKRISDTNGLKPISINSKKNLDGSSANLLVALSG